MVEICFASLKKKIIFVGGILRPTCFCALTWFLFIFDNYYLRFFQKHIELINFINCNYLHQLCLKLAFAIFIYILPRESTKKLWKMLFILLKKLFSFSGSFFPVGHCWIYRRSWLKISPKGYDVTKLLLCSSFFRA